MDAVVDFARVEEGELLLVAQHLERRLAEDGEVERGLLARGIGEDDLMRERGLAGARLAHDDVEGVLGDAAAEDQIELVNAGGQLADLRA